jgi:hypothetical protein
MEAPPRSSSSARRELEGVDVVQAHLSGQGLVRTLFFRSIRPSPAGADSVRNGQEYYRLVPKQKGLRNLIMGLFFFLYLSFVHAGRVIAEGLKPEETSVVKVMTRNPVFVMSSTSAIQALQEMFKGLVS